MCKYVCHQHIILKQMAELRKQLESWNNICTAVVVHCLPAELAPESDEDEEGVPGLSSEFFEGSNEQEDSEPGAELEPELSGEEQQMGPVPYTRICQEERRPEQWRFMGQLLRKRRRH